MDENLSLWDNIPFMFLCGILVTLECSMPFLSLLDYGTRAHEICPSSVRPSVRVAITSEPNVRISFKFWLFLRLGDIYARMSFFFNF